MGLRAPTKLADEARVSESRLRELQQELKTLPKMIPSPQTHQRIGFHGHAVEPAWVMIDFGRNVTPEKIVLFPARPAVAKALRQGLV